MKLTAEEVAIHFNRPIVVNEEGCWLWLGSTDKGGYARLGGYLLVHGAVWRMAGFECIGNVELCHKCPNHNCINPDHIYVGTHQENMNDDNRQQMGPKGRISEENLVIARQMLIDGRTRAEVGRFLGVSPSWMNKFRRGEFKYAQPC